MNENKKNLKSKKNPDLKPTPGKLKKEIKVFLVFLCFSLGAAVIELTSYSLLSLFNNESFAFLKIREYISVALSCLFNMTVNRKYTFKSSRNIYVALIVYAALYTLMTIFSPYLIRTLMEAGVPEFVAKLIKMVLNFIVEFSICNFILFKKSKETVIVNDNNQLNQIK